MKFVRIAAILSALSVCQAQAQTSGSVTNHAFALGKGAGVTGYTSLLCTSAQLAVGQAAADPICQTITGDVTISAAGVTAIGAGIVHSSMLNADVFSTAHSWSATQSFPNNSLTLAELPTIGANTVLGSVAGGTPAALTQAQITAMINLATGSLSGALPAWPNNTTTYFRGDGTYATHNFASLGGQATFAQFPTGSLDQVIGYFGATTANALAINNCTNALTYSTTTHTFGCNSSAGTGTVTNVGTAGLATGGPITASGTVTVTAAIKSDQTASSSTSVVVVPGVQQYHPSAAKAYVDFSGSTTNGNQTLNSSYNVSSVSRSSVGVYSVTFSTPFADTNFACMATNGSGGSINGWGQVGAKTTTTILLNFLSNSSTAFDPTKGDVVCFGLE